MSSVFLLGVQRPFKGRMATFVQGIEKIYFQFFLIKRKKISLKINFFFIFYKLNSLFHDKIRRYFFFKENLGEWSFDSYLKNDPHILILCISQSTKSK